MAEARGVGGGKSTLATGSAVEAPEEGVVSGLPVATGAGATLDVCVAAGANGSPGASFGISRVVGTVREASAVATGCGVSTVGDAGVEVDASDGVSTGGGVAW